MKTDTNIGTLRLGDTKDNFDPEDWLGELVDGRYQIGNDPKKDILDITIKTNI